MPAVLEIHVKCHNRLNVAREDDESFESGWWKVAKKRSRIGTVLALHEEKRLPSYLHGTVTEVIGRDDGRLMFRVRKSTAPLRWRGVSSGERGYLYEDNGRFDHLPSVPCAIGPVDSAISPSIRPLRETERWSYPRAGGLLPRPMGETTLRQEQFEADLVRLSAIAENGAIPYAFRDVRREPFQLDEGCIQFALNRHVLAIPVPDADGFVRTLFPGPALLQGHAVVAVIARETFQREQNANVPPNIPDEYNPGDIPPEVVLRLIRTKPRIGQGPFRDDLLALYGGRCAVSGCSIGAILEAAHILPHEDVGGAPADVRNGLLLRSDLHRLFDAGLVGFRFDDADRLRVHLHPDLMRSEYSGFHGRIVAAPIDLLRRPSKICVAQRAAAMPVGY